MSNETRIGRQSETTQQNLSQEVLLEESNRLIQRLKEAFAIDSGISDANFIFSPNEEERWSLAISDKKFRINVVGPSRFDGNQTFPRADFLISEGNFTLWDWELEERVERNTKRVLDKTHKAVEKVIGLRNPIRPT